MNKTVKFLLFYNGATLFAGMVGIAPHASEAMWFGTVAVITYEVWQKYLNT